MKIKKYFCRHCGEFKGTLDVGVSKPKIISCGRYPRGIKTNIRCNDCGELIWDTETVLEEVLKIYTRGIDTKGVDAK